MQKARAFQMARKSAQASAESGKAVLQVTGKGSYPNQGITDYSARFKTKCLKKMGKWSHGWSSYGDPQYVPHVMRYYSGGDLFAGLFGNQQIVSVAMGQLGNSGGQKFWSWYGFDSRVEWCACFVSWCADQSGLIASGNVPKFSFVQ